MRSALASLSLSAPPRQLSLGAPEGASPSRVEGVAISSPAERRREAAKENEAAFAGESRRKFGGRRRKERLPSKASPSAGQHSLPGTSVAAYRRLTLRAREASLACHRSGWPLCDHVPLNARCSGSSLGLGEYRCACLFDYLFESCWGSVFPEPAMCTALVAPGAAAVEAVAALLRSQLVEDIARSMQDEDCGTAVAAIEALAGMGQRGAAFADEVADALEDPRDPVRSAAAAALEAFGWEGAPGAAAEGQ
ncbi:unnamed protein product [Prorocentrum cordatum]|uniref:HEAT repeat domain-containing protein n=1 Tax=Prorocentrum cordatum TaxID=2364126 RepID=A0ABN9UDX7_9DINO|nr:unnamed protein product [Polarella glacialis]